MTLEEIMATVRLKSLFSRKYRKLKNALGEIHIIRIPVMGREYDGDNFIKKLAFFSDLFYQHGFLGSTNQAPAFPSAYKNISNSILGDTYIALPIYFSFRYGLADSNFKSIDELKTALLKLYPTLDSGVIDILLSEWGKANPSKLADLLYEHFEKYNVFEKVFAEGADARKWFKNFLNQTYDYSLKR